MKTKINKVLKKFNQFFWKLAMVLFMIAGVLDLLLLVMIIRQYSNVALFFSILYSNIGRVVTILLGLLAFIELKDEYVLKKYLN